MAEHDLPYTEVLTADYIMANPYAAKGYGASTEFDDPADVHEFKPSEIVSYYRDHDSKVSEDSEFGIRVSDPGDLSTDYPHAGILNTTVFLLRYPTTATNRNRARSRWTYYHFLGVDIEKSASRPTDPAALADTNNPTMDNPACTVCHSVLDPVAGAFQNYGDIGLYRDQWDGLDSLDASYKDDPAARFFEIGADAWTTRQTVAVEAWLRKGESRVFLGNPHNNWWDHDSQQGGTHGRDVRLHDLAIRTPAGDIVQRFGAALFDEHCEYDGEWVEGAGEDDHWRFWGHECVLPVDIPADGAYVVEAVAWADRSGDEVASLQLGTAPLYRDGDTWYRDMRAPGFDAERAPDPDSSLQWLARRIASDPRFADAAVRFWWPAVMGFEVAEPPSEGDANFDGRLLASNGQTAEVSRLASGFRRGFRNGHAYNLKDLLTELVLSKWFRASSTTGGDPVRATALANAGARRLLTPEELSRKTVALTGFDWQRDRLWLRVPGDAPNWINAERAYGLLYGGIDSDGITKRGRDLTSVMAGVAKRHALAVSCPVVMKDLYLAADGERRLFGHVDPAIDPSRSGTITAAAAQKIHAQLVELHQKLLGVEAAGDSPEIQVAYDLFRTVWERKQASNGTDFRGMRCDWDSDDQYLDGIVDDAIVYQNWDWGEGYGWDWDRINAHFETIDWSDPHHVARTWVVVLAYLMTDPRYLHL